MFRDITTLLGSARAFRRAVDELVQPWAGSKIDKIAGIEARGFIIGGAIAHQLSAGFVPIRKKGKLPHKSVRVAYSLEYGIDEMEMHEDAVAKGERVILVDDLIATGGTATARSSCCVRWAPTWWRRCSWSTCRISAAPTSCGRSMCRCARWCRSRGISVYPACAIFVPIGRSSPPPAARFSSRTKSASRSDQRGPGPCCSRAAGFSGTPRSRVRPARSDSRKRARA